MEVCLLRSDKVGKKDRGCCNGIWVFDFSLCLVFWCIVIRVLYFYVKWEVYLFGLRWFELVIVIYS